MWGLDLFQWLRVRDLEKGALQLMVEYRERLLNDAVHLRRAQAVRFVL